MAATANLFFLFAVCTIWAVESLIFDGRQLAGVSLVPFIIGELLLVVYFAALAASDRFGALVEILVRAARSGIAKDGARAEPEGRAGGRVRRLLTNLWTPVTLNFVLAGGLVYASGGVVNSPYNQVPIAMFLIGQSIYEVPPIELRHHERIPRIVVFAATLARLYVYPLFLIVLLELSVVGLQATHPLVTTSAPPALVLVSILITLFAGMCVTFVTRRADRANASVAPLPSQEQVGSREDRPGPVDPDEDRSDEMTPVA